MFFDYFCLAIIFRFNVNSDVKSHTLLDEFIFVYFSSIHTIRVKTDANIQAGQRVNVTGKLKSIIRRTNDGKNLPLVVVKADQLCVVRKENGVSSSSTDEDVNSVELLSYIADIMNTGEDSFLLLATNYQYM